MIILKNREEQFDEEYEQDVLEIRKNTGEAVFLQLRRLDFIKKLLDEAEGAEPAADHAAEEDTPKQKDADDVVPRALLGGGERVLERA